VHLVGFYYKNTGTKSCSISTQIGSLLLLNIYIVIRNIAVVR